MFLRKINVTNFKNYESQELAFSERLNCLTGPNGAGKTNILDAIYYLCMCKSYTSGQDKNVVKQNETFFRLVGNFEIGDKKSEIVFKVQPGKKKEVLKNESNYDKITEHVGNFPVVMIAPDDTVLATEGSEARRRFLDNTLSQLDAEYLDNLLIYNRLVDQRNAALKQFFVQNNFSPELLESYDERLVPLGIFLFQKRVEFFELFYPIFQKFYRFISLDADVVELSYESKLKNQHFGTLLKQNISKDRILQRTSVGIHKDDLIFEIKGMPIKKFASQGQLKSFILALKLAQFELLKNKKSVFPILLLDDIFDKLDEIRVHRLLALLNEQGFGQVFLTDTHNERIQLIIKDLQCESKIFYVENSTIKLQ